MKLEYVDSLLLAHPFTKGFDQVHCCATDDEVRAVAQGDVSDAVSKRKKEDIEGKDGASTVYSTTFYIGLAIEPKQPGAVGPRRLDISYPTTEFTKLVKMWEKFDDASMGIVVRHIKSTALPDYVFDEVERQTKSAQKRPKFSKGGGKSSNASPDMPNKRRRSSQHPPSNDLQSATQIIPPTTTLRAAQNGLTVVTPVPPSLDVPASRIYKGPDINLAQLSYGDQVAVTTGAGGH